MSRNTPATKRLMKEYSDLLQDPSPEFVAAPLQDNLLEWHFTIRGPPEGGFLGGRYHGRINFPPDYPFKPPAIMFLTPNGRFETNKKICLSITSFHPEFWRPSWGVRSALTAVGSFMLTPGEGAIGAIDFTEEERRVLATKSVSWRCEQCGGGGKEGLEDTGGEKPPAPEEPAAQEAQEGEEPTADAEGLRKRVVNNPSAVTLTDDPAPPALAPRPAPAAVTPPVTIDPALEARRGWIDTVIVLIFLLISYIVVRRVGILYAATVRV